MEDFSIKAIVIGVSLFVTMMTLSAILIYFNTARSIADEVNKRTDIASSYDYIMNDDTYEDKLSGVEVRSLINKYAGSEKVIINILSISGQDPSNYKERDINDDKIKYININNNTSWVANNMIKDAMLDLINPVWNCNVNKVENLGQITLNIDLDVKD